MISSRFDSEKAGDREVQRTMLELLNQLDGFQPNTQVKVTFLCLRVRGGRAASRDYRVAFEAILMRKMLIGSPASQSTKITVSGFSLIQVIAATNRVDILDPALLRSGRLDRKIEFPMPNEEARARIMQIHSRKMNVRY